MDDGRLLIRGRMAQVTVGLPPALVDAVDLYAMRETRSRARMMELLLREALEQRGTLPVRDVKTPPAPKRRKGA
jgi:hypothetical protein